MSEGRNFDKLIRQALRLKRQARADTRLPPLFFMTDEERTPDPVATVRLLPGNAAVIFRHYTDRHRNTLARQLRDECKKRGLPFFVAGHGPLAYEVRANGIHLPQWQIPRITKYRRERRLQFISAAVHDLPAAIEAAKRGASLLMAAPVFATSSHPNQPHLNIHKLAALVNATSLPVYALGGVSAVNAAKLLRTGAAGMAGITMFTESPPKSRRQTTIKQGRDMRSEADVRFYEHGR